MKTIILAGGCFWGMEDLFRKQPGIITTRVGYSGGDLQNPTYADVRRGDTGHAEAIEIIYDKELTSLHNILIFFFKMHDSTTKNRQGNDIGSQYRSIIFYKTDEEKEIAQDIITRIDAAGYLPGKIVTELTAEMPFYEAEPEHQSYLERYPTGYTCHFVRKDWDLPNGSPPAA